MQQYYVAVGSVQGKAATLLDLLSAVIAETERALTVGVCCSARDTCDEIVAALIKVCPYSRSRASNCQMPGVRTRGFLEWAARARDP